MKKATRCSYLLFLLSLFYRYIFTYLDIQTDILKTGIEPETPWLAVALTTIRPKSHLR